MQDIINGNIEMNKLSKTNMTHFNENNMLSTIISIIDMSLIIGTAENRMIDLNERVLPAACIYSHLTRNSCNFLQLNRCGNSIIS